MKGPASRERSSHGNMLLLHVQHQIHLGQSRQRRRDRYRDYSDKLALNKRPSAAFISIINLLSPFLLNRGFSLLHQDWPVLFRVLERSL